MQNQPFLGRHGRLRYLALNEAPRLAASTSGSIAASAATCEPASDITAASSAIPNTLAVVRIVLMNASTIAI